MNCDRKFYTHAMAKAPVRTLRVPTDVPEIPALVASFVEHGGHICGLCGGSTFFPHCHEKIKTPYPVAQAGARVCRCQRGRLPTQRTYALRRESFVDPTKFRLSAVPRYYFLVHDLCTECAEIYRVAPLPIQDPNQECVPSASEWFERFRASRLRGTFEADVAAAAEERAADLARRNESHLVAY